MALNFLTPSELNVPANATGTCRRRICLRNALWKTTILVKLTVSPKNDYAIKMNEEFLRLNPRQMAHIYVDFDVVKLKYLKNVEHTITGFVKEFPLDHQKASKWLLTEGFEMKSQKAFALNIRVSPHFSAYETIIDLPGKALIEMPFKEDLGSACEIGSQMSLVEELRPKNCWLTNAVTNLLKKSPLSQYAWEPEDKKMEEVLKKEVTSHWLMGSTQLEYASLMKEKKNEEVSV